MKIYHQRNFKSIVEPLKQIVENINSTNDESQHLKKKLTLLRIKILRKENLKIMKMFMMMKMIMMVIASR